MVAWRCVGHVGQARVSKATVGRATPSVAGRMLRACETFPRQLFLDRLARAARSRHFRVRLLRYRMRSRPASRVSLTVAAPSFFGGVAVRGPRRTSSCFQGCAWGRSALGGGTHAARLRNFSEAAIFRQASARGPITTCSGPFLSLSYAIAARSARFFGSRGPEFFWWRGVARATSDRLVSRRLRLGTQRPRWRDACCALAKGFGGR